MDADSFPFTDAYPEARRAIPRRVETRRASAVLDAAGCVAPERLLAAAAPARLRKGARTLLDFGRECVGWVRGWARGEPGRLRLVYGERRGEAERGEPSRVHFFTLQEDFPDVRADGVEFRSRGRRAFRYLAVSWDGPGDLELGDLRVEHTHADVAERGAFRCSDERLNRAWALSVETTRLCMQDFYEDGVKRDGLLWIGDYRVQFLCNTAAFGDVALARKSLSMIAASQRADGAIPACAGLGGGKQHPTVIDCMPGIPRWPERWILHNYMTDFIGALLEYHEYTGDTAFVQLLWPAARAALRYLAEQADPEAADYADHFISDDSLAGADGRPLRPRGALYGHLCWGFAQGAALAALCGDAQTASFCRAAQACTSARFRSRYFDAEQGLFRDAADQPPVGWHVNAIAALAGLMDDPVSSFSALLRQRDVPRPQIGYLRFWTLEALCAAGLLREALENVGAVWGGLPELGFTTCPETIYEDAARYDERRTPLSMCHGWSAGPCRLLSRHVLGARPAAPGWTAARLRPALGDLAWAEGRIPTPRGEIEVRWEATARGLRGEVRLPEGMTGVLETAAGQMALRPGWTRVP